MTDDSTPIVPSASRAVPASRSRLRASALAVAAALALAACDSPEERAEGHFREALAFIQAGDTTRAELELRNVFDLDGLHRDARATYAALRRADGDVTESYGQYLRLVEQYPDDVEGLRALALMATDRRDWEQVRRHGTAGIALAPDDPGLRAAMTSLAYRDALEAGDEDAADAAAEEARVILGEDPSLTSARILVADGLLRGGSDDLALEVIEAGLALDAANRDLRQLRLGLLARSGDAEALRAELEDSLALFPDDQNLAATYLRLLVSVGDLDAAEDYLRGRIDPEAPAFEDRAALLDFQRRLLGPEEMRAELDALIADPEVEDRALFRAMRAGLDFEEGRREDGIAAMSALLSEVEEGSDLAPEELGRLHVSLARMREATGDRVGARASVEAALAVEPGQPDALKLRAAWQIENDETDAAISSLRAALAGAPRDAQIMTLLAQAHRRDGDTALAGDMLARAVEVSGNAPAESLRYASFLAAEGRAGPADSVISDALRLAPEDPDLLAALGRLRAASGEWDRVGEIIARLRALEDEDAALQADNLEATLLSGQERTEELERVPGRDRRGRGRRRPRRRDRADPRRHRRGRHRRRAGARRGAGGRRARGRAAAPAARGGAHRRRARRGRARGHPRGRPPGPRERARAPRAGARDPPGRGRRGRRGSPAARPPARSPRASPCNGCAPPTWSAPATGRARSRSTRRSTPATTACSWSPTTWPAS